MIQIMDPDPSAQTPIPAQTDAQPDKTPEKGNSARKRPHLKAFAWTRERAIEAGRKGGKMNGKAFKVAKVAAEIDTLQAKQAAYEQNELRRMREEISRTREQLAEETDADQRFKLGCLLKKEWEIYQLLAGMPGPGTRKPKPESTRRSPSICLPTDETE